jgi:hypothetical protein
MASGRSGAPELTGGGAKEREEHGELSSGLTGARAAAWRPGDGGGSKRSQETWWGGFPSWERRGEGHGEVWVLWGSSGGFYRARGGRRWVGRSNGRG